MKKKFLILTLCFTLIFTSINYKRSYADGGVISLPILATVVSLGVGAGIVINNNEGLYDLGNKFYNYINNHNDLTWDLVKSTFITSVVVLNNNLVSVKSEFLDIVKVFFDTSYNSNLNYSISSNYGVPHFTDYQSFKEYYTSKGEFSFDSSDYVKKSFTIGNILFNYLSDRQSSTYTYYEIFVDDILLGQISFPTSSKIYRVGTVIASGKLFLGVGDTAASSWSNYSIIDVPIFDTSISLDGYTWDNVENKKEEDKSISLPIPGNLGQLVGQGSTDFWDNTDNLVGTGGITIPGVDDPSIDLDDSISFPTVEDVPDVDLPVDTPFANITEYIIGLVVPSDSYWTDTFGGLYNNFTSSFPMVDMEGFKQLVTGEKKFPNIDINIMGVNGRVVNGDVVNSIVEWLRPIIAGFMMLCLMLFNYRKIYKTIRGVEPFQGIAQGTSDFRTGISEYNYMGTGLSKADYDANQMELAKALYDYEQDTGKTYKIKI